MSPVEFGLRILIGGAIIIFGVLAWAVSPYLEGTHIIGSGVLIDAPIMSVFFGNAEPQGYTVLALLWARGCFGMTVASWVIIPAAQYFYDSNFKPLARAAQILFMSGSVAAFLFSLLVHIFYYGGGTLFA